LNPAALSYRLNWISVFEIGHVDDLLFFVREVAYYLRIAECHLKGSPHQGG
jgi:hypothetical protein